MAVDADDAAHDGGQVAAAGADEAAHDGGQVAVAGAAEAAHDGEQAAVAGAAEDPQGAAELDSRVPEVADGAKAPCPGAGVHGVPWLWPGASAGCWAPGRGRRSLAALRSLRCPPSASTAPQVAEAAALASAGCMTPHSRPHSGEAAGR